MAKLAFGDVLVLLPGITGSVLERDGRPVWAPTPGVLWHTVATLGRTLKDLELDHDSPELDDGIRATGLVSDVHLIPGLWKIDGYGRIRDYLRERLTLEDGANWFEFPY